MNYSLIESGVKVELHDETYEGWTGDYNPDDPEDNLLLRFDVSVFSDNEWQPVDNGSYCTALPATVSTDAINLALNIIMREVGDAVRSGASIKKTCENLSWISPSWLSNNSIAV